MAMFRYQMRMQHSPDPIEWGPNSLAARFPRVEDQFKDAAEARRQKRREQLKASRARLRLVKS